ncbi:hydantoinase/oxoprolinase family protein [Halioxenophilus aromaticivorans]|uniref:Hydantoinase/oxoprolinase family protein n=1 Tax=Halioxenophilus aromaticivorans TaxID=1306992 RepID=A0AAV3U8M2_9ALTE
MSGLLFIRALYQIYTLTGLIAPLELTIGASERIGADGTVVASLDEEKLLKDLTILKNKGGIEALTICLVNAYVNNEHEQRARTVAENVFGDIPISISSEVVPEMQEYERTETTVVNSYVRPEVSRYISNLHGALTETMGADMQLSILRSDGGLASARAASESPVNLLMSGPAGGATGAIYFCEQAGYKDILTFDMGGTSTDVALIQNARARVRRETYVGDVKVRAPSVDIRTVGAGGGSIAFVPELTKALRVGPESAGAVPGPACYMKGGEAPTVCDANVVLGYLPSDIQLGGAMEINREASVKAVQNVADAIGIDVMAAAEGIIEIVNEAMFGALRLVSVEQGYDPRDFSLVGYGGAGPLHANALGILTQAWPVIVPPGPGVLCAYGDATTQVQDEASRTYLASATDIDSEQLLADLLELQSRAAAVLIDDDIPESEHQVTFQADVRYAGQAFQITVDFSEQEFIDAGLSVITDQFDAEHKQLFSFKLEEGHEILMIRAVVKTASTEVAIATGDNKDLTLDDCKLGDTRFYYAKQWHDAVLYDRSKLPAGCAVPGPAIVIEMDSTTLLLPNHEAMVDSIGNLLINPMNQE